MQEYKYIIMAIPPSNNKYIGVNRRWDYQEAKKQWEKIIHFVCRDKPPKPIQKAIVNITYYFKDNIRRDPDNYSGKMLLDGLVRAGVIEDDSFKNIDLVLKAYFKCKEPRIEITITPIEKIEIEEFL